MKLGLGVIEFNLVDAKMMEEAQQYPEQQTIWSRECRS